MKPVKIIFFLLIFSYIHLYVNAGDIFWETEKIIAGGSIGSFKVCYNDKVIAVIYNDISNTFNLYLRYTSDAVHWSPVIPLVNGFFSNNPFGDDFGCILDRNNTLYICYRLNKNQFSLKSLAYPYDNNKLKTLQEVSSSGNSIYQPELFSDTKSHLHLIYADDSDNRFKIQYQKFDLSGKLLLKTNIGPAYKASINPVLYEYNSNLYIVFQAKDAAVQSGFFYNIILAESKDDGINWSYKRIVTSKGENNQGPQILLDNNQCHLVWEKEDADFICHIYYKSFYLNADPEKANPIMISSATSEAHAPGVVKFKNLFYIFWYDNAGGSYQNYYTQIADDLIMESGSLTTFNGRTLKNIPIVVNKNQLFFFWLQSDTRNTLYFQKPDNFVETPQIFVKNINGSRPVNFTDIKFEWNPINDPSGIKGYRALLTHDKNADINNTSPLIYEKETAREYQKLDDGEWFFKLKAYDLAGNTSNEASYHLVIDTKPPEAPNIIDPDFNKDGGLSTNSPVIEWNSSEPVETYLYQYQLFISGNVDEVENYKINAGLNTFKYTKEQKLTFKNLENGLLLIGLRCYDAAGNLSETSWKTYRLSSFVATTEIRQIGSLLLADGSEVIVISGTGFKADGNVEAIYLDKDRKEPYDYILGPDYFTVVNDRFIRQTRSIKIDEGQYFIGINHPKRGIVFYSYKAAFNREWLFKFSEPNYFTFDRIVLIFQKMNLTIILLTVGFILWLLLIIILSKSIFNTVRDQLYLKSLLTRLEQVKHEISSQEYIERRRNMHKKGLGLTLKYTILILALVITVVSATSITLSALALKNETIYLANEMKERANLVLANYEKTMADIYTYDKGFHEAVDATVNLVTLPDIGYALFRESSGTIFLRYGSKSAVFFKGHDPKKMSDDEKEKYTIETTFTPSVEKDLQQISTNSDGYTYSYPEFNPTNLKDHYIFIKPILIKDGDQVTHAVDIVLGYSFEKILALIKTERVNLIVLAFFVTLGAIVISVFGSFFLATTTIRPIKKMSKHVNVIASTEDYEMLLGTENEKIIINSRDEIGTLASSINDMTIKLIEKAKADKQMMLGKEIQKKFIPLEPVETAEIDIFGFYEGAKGVSGDYFDFKKLDNEHYAFIICDVAGKAVPAALIMVQISTIFHSFCTSYNPKSDKNNTVSIVNTINDTVAERGFSGRFAAILVMILNVKTGKALMTNAGYTQLLVYQDRLGRAEWIKLNPDSGAAGVFPSYMLPHPYIQEEIMINPKDIIYLFTDGLEESRNGKTVTDEKGENHAEEFGQHRILNILSGSRGKSPKEMIQILIEEEKLFRGDNEQYDDLTILGIKRKI